MSWQKEVLFWLAMVLLIALVIGLLVHAVPLTTCEGCPTTTTQAVVQ